MADRRNYQKDCHFYPWEWEILEELAIAESDRHEEDRQQLHLPRRKTFWKLPARLGLNASSSQRRRSTQLDSGVP